jgi:hypothetical protein
MPSKGEIRSICASLPGVKRPEGTPELSLPTETFGVFLSEIINAGLTAAEGVLLAILIECAEVVTSATETATEVGRLSVFKLSTFSTFCTMGSTSAGVKSETLRAYVEEARTLRNNEKNLPKKNANILS